MSSSFVFAPELFTTLLYVVPNHLFSVWRTHFTCFCLFVHLFSAYLCPQMFRPREATSKPGEDCGIAESLPLISKSHSQEILSCLLRRRSICLQPGAKRGMDSGLQVPRQTVEHTGMVHQHPALLSSQQPRRVTCLLKIDVCIFCVFIVPRKFPFGYSFSF